MMNDTTFYSVDWTENNVPVVVRHSTDDDGNPTEDRWETSHIYVVCYEVDRAYGGPEEGGWWYDVGEPVAAIPVRTPEEERKAREFLNELYPQPKQISAYPKPRISVSAHFPQPYPDTRPHYE